MAIQKNSLTMMYFFVNTKFTSSRKVTIGDGRNNNHLNICLTSKALMKNCELNGVYQIDATYKIIKNRFPLMVFGNTDFQGKFHPICFMVSSHETEEDFFNLYSGLIELADKMGISFEPDYIMQDACQASYNAAIKLFNADILMCYFHVLHNVRKNIKHLNNNDYECLISDIRGIHYSTNNENYLKLLLSFKKKYRNDPKVLAYMNEQWFDSLFSKWQIFRNCPGMANTNSNIESFNSTIRDFSYYPKFNKKVYQFCMKLEKKSFKKIYSNRTIVNGKHVLNNEDKSCSCQYFVKKGLCIHSVRLNIMNNLSWISLSISILSLFLEIKEEQNLKKKDIFWLKKLFILID